MKRKYKYNVGDTVRYRIRTPAISCCWNGRSSDYTDVITKRLDFGVEKGLQYAMKNDNYLVSENSILKRIKKVKLLTCEVKGCGNKRRHLITCGPIRICKKCNDNW